ncbi:MAG: amidohydrolase family protein [Terriglobales bacterium]
MKRIIFAVLALALSQWAEAQVTVVRAGRLIDPDSGTVLTNQVILIKDGKIQAVGGALALPANATVIDLSQKTVLPGLIDCHTHVADGQSDGEPFNVLRKTASQIALESVPNARAMLLSGFTTVRDVGTYRALNDIALRDAIARGDVIGPRMFVAGLTLRSLAALGRSRDRLRIFSCRGTCTMARRTARGKSARKCGYWRTTASM